MFAADTLNKRYRFCYSLTVTKTSTYDLLQNTLAFMYSIIRHQFIDDYRKQSKYQVIAFKEQEHIGFDVKTLDSLSIDNNLIEQVLQYLDPKEREILFCCAIEGYSIQQIAETL
jgi:RNA polymerase sigma factor (sigma-70 family)